MNAPLGSLALIHRMLTRLDALLSRGMTRVFLIL